MYSDVGGERLAVNQQGPDFALVEPTQNHLPGPAYLSVAVDEALAVRPVFLPDGIQSGVERIRLALNGKWVSS